MDRAKTNSWYALLLLGAAYTCNSIDRQVLAVAIEPIKHQFGVSDRLIGLLGGLFYTTAFAIACVPLGWLADRLNRRTLLSVLLATWAGLTLLTGSATSILMLVLARMGVGAAESGAQPVCVSLISDFFPPAKRSSAIGYFYLSSAVGLIISFLVGGWAVAHWGWQAAFYLAGVPGLVVALIIATTMAEPPRGTFEVKTEPPVGIFSVLQHIWTCLPLRHLTIGTTLASMVVSTTWLWSASLLIRTHGLSISKAGPLVAIAAAGSAIGSAMAGRLADHIGRGSAARRMMVPIATTLLCAPFGIGFALLHSTPLCVACLVALGLTMGGYLGPCFSTMTVLAPAHMRGTCASVLQVVINLVGTGLGPLAAGLLSDRLGPQHGLSDALALLMLVNIWAALHFLYVRILLAAPA